MGYQFECDHVIPGCEGVVNGETRDEVMEAVSAHASEVHDMNDLSDDVVEKVKISIVPTP